MDAAITIVGLGPGDARLLTREAWDVLLAAAPLYLRTARHPVVVELPDDVPRVNFDHVYEEAEDFADVYAAITAEVLRLAEQQGHVVYAVPGHPHVGEATVTGILAQSRMAQIAVRIIPGISFVEPVLSALNVDGLAGLQLFDAIEVAARAYPPLNPDVPALLGQVYSQLLAGELKLNLMGVYPPEHEVVLVHAAGTTGELVERVPLYAVDRSPHIDHLTTLFIPPRPVPSSLQSFAEAIAVLRGPEGCPWDQEQTPQSLRSGFLEEVAEVLDALDVDDPVALQEELGDVLLHIVMQTQMAREEERFDLADVLAGIYAKIRYRHPHVWGDWEVSDTADVMANWEALKAREKGDNAQHSILDSIPLTFPALARSQKIQKRVKKVGFDWDDVSGVVTKLQEEIAELQAAPSQLEQHREIGDVLFAAVNWARWLEIDAEVALREANRRFTRRFRHMEQLAQDEGLLLGELGVAALEILWQRAKKALVQEEAGGN